MVVAPSLLEQLQRAPESPQLVTSLVASASLLSYAMRFRGDCDHLWQTPALAARYLSAGVLVVAQYALRGCRSRFGDAWTLRFELQTALSRCLARSGGHRVAIPEFADKIRRDSEALGEATAHAVARSFGLAVRHFTFHGLRHTYVVAPTGDPTQASKHRVVACYYHGGGYVSCCPDVFVATAAELQTRIVRWLRDKLGCDVQVDVLLANYRKAPQFPYPSPPQDAHIMYKYLLDEEKLSPSQIIVMGDSAGAGLSLTTLLRVRDEDPTKLPLAGVLIHPFIDPEQQGDERKTPYCTLVKPAVEALWRAYLPQEETDPATMGDAYPLRCSMRGLPPVYILGAEHDYILSHSTDLMDKAIADGQTDWKLKIIPKVPHGFLGFPGDVLPNAPKGFDALAEYTATQFASALVKPF